MKRMIAGVLLLIGLGAGTLFAEDGYRRERDIRHDEAKIAHDRWELRRALYYELRGCRARATRVAPRISRLGS